MEKNKCISTTIPPVWIFRISQKIRYFLKSLDSKLVPANVAVFEKSQAFWISKAIGVACELNLADILKSGPKALQEIALIANANEHSLYRLMRALASEGIFKENKGKIFSNTVLSLGLAERKGSMKNMIRHQLNETNWEMIGKLGHSIRTGTSASGEFLGNDIFSHLKSNPEKNELYNTAMSETSALASSAFLAVYSFNKSQIVVDIGGGEGLLLSMILQKNKHLKGILFDLPHVVKKANETFNKFGVEDRASVEEGDFFNKIPAGGDTYIMKNILHAFDDQSCITLLKNLNSVMIKNGNLLIMEAVLSENNRPEYGKIFDLQMLIGTMGGKERTRQEFELLLKQSGFKLNRVLSTVSPFSILEGIKRS
jgi:hypothetical protein